MEAINMNEKQELEAAINYLKLKGKLPEFFDLKKHGIHAFYYANEDSEYRTTGKGMVWVFSILEKNSLIKFPDDYELCNWCDLTYYTKSRGGAFFDAPEEKGKQEMENKNLYLERMSVGLSTLPLPKMYHRTYMTITYL